MVSKRRSGFGNVRKLPSGRYHARYMVGEARFNGPTTFITRKDAETWLAKARLDIAKGAWISPDSKTKFRDYADTWLAHRKVKGEPLRPRTRALYRNLLDDHILPTFGASPIRSLTPAAVRDWHAKLPAGTRTLNARAYALLKSICATAVDDDLIAANPCRIRGASSVSRASKTQSATLDELTALIDNLPARRYQLMVLLAAWCALRFGELTELRGYDMSTRTGAIDIQRGVVWPDDEDLEDVEYCDCLGDRSHIVGPTKSEAGAREVNIPPHLLPAVREYLLESGAGRNGLLFPASSGGHMRTSALYKVYYPARKKAGRPDLRFHDLRHTGANLAAATGATLAELMARLGHSTPSAALRYQHAAKGRDAEIAKALSDLASQRTQRTP